MSKYMNVSFGELEGILLEPIFREFIPQVYTMNERLVEIVIDEMFPKNKPGSNTKYSFVLHLKIYLLIHTFVQRTNVSSAPSQWDNLIADEKSKWIFPSREAASSDESFNIETPFCE